MIAGSSQDIAASAAAMLVELVDRHEEEEHGGAECKGYRIALITFIVDALGGAVAGVMVSEETPGFDFAHEPERRQFDD